VAESTNWRPIGPLITRTGRVLNAGQLRPIYGAVRSGKKIRRTCGLLSQSGTDHRRQMVHSSNRPFQHSGHACDPGCGNKRAIFGPLLRETAGSNFRLDTLGQIMIKVL